MKVENPSDVGEQIASSGASVEPSLEVIEDDRHQEHFKTDHLLTNLKGRAISSGAVTMSAQAAKFLLNLVSIMILARLLTPREFGIVAMVTTVAGFLRVFKDAGLSTATVQREVITHAQVSNLFWINIAVSAFSSLVLAGSAPIIAWFYHNPRLIDITLLLSATFLISGSTVQHQALLKRQMRFKALALIDVCSMAVGVLVAIGMALLGCGYWSLVGSSLSMEIAGLLFTWSASRWRPGLPSRRSGIGPLLRFGAHQTAGSLIATIARGSDNLLIVGFIRGPSHSTLLWCAGGVLALAIGATWWQLARTDYFWGNPLAASAISERDRFRHGTGRRALPGRQVRSVPF